MYAKHVRKAFQVLFVTILVAGISFGAGAANAETKIAIVNIQKIMSESKAAQSIQGQLNKHRKTFQDEFSKLERDLQDQEKSLVDQRSKLSAEDYAKKRQAFESKVMDTRKLVQKRQQALEGAAGDALNELRQKLVSIVSDISDKDHYDMVLSRQNVLVAGKDMDITDEVMKQLDKQLKEVKLKVETN